MEMHFISAIKSGKPLPDHGDDPQAKEDLNSVRTLSSPLHMLSNQFTKS